MLSIAEGFRAAVTVSGAEDVAVVLRGAPDEMTSGLSREECVSSPTRPASPALRTARWPPAELFVMINLTNRSTKTDGNLAFRGVEKAALSVRGDVKIVEGRKFEPGRNEMIVGIGAARTFAGTEVGHKVRIGQNEWTVVGIFAGGGGAGESEIWTDAAVLQPAYNRSDSFQSVLVKLTSPAFPQFKDALTGNPQLG